MTQPLSPEELGQLFDAIEREPTQKLSELAKVAGLSLAEDYIGVDLKGDDLSNDDLNGANFSHSNLSHVNLNKTDLSQANLSQVDLSYANLSEANLTGANLTGANLTGAELKAANLTGVNYINYCINIKEPFLFKRRISKGFSNFTILRIYGFFSKIHLFDYLTIQAYFEFSIIFFLSLLIAINLNELILIIANVIYMVFFAINNYKMIFQFFIILFLPNYKNVIIGVHGEYIRYFIISDFWSKMTDIQLDNLTIPAILLIVATIVLIKSIQLFYTNKKSFRDFYRSLSKSTQK